MAKVTNISEKSRSSMTQSPEYILEQALAEIRDDDPRGAFANGKKMLILMLDDTEQRYEISYYNAGMKMSECVALSEMAKSKFKEDMNY